MAMIEHCDQSIDKGGRQTIFDVRFEFIGQTFMPNFRLGRFVWSSMSVDTFKH